MTSQRRTSMPEWKPTPYDAFLARIADVDGAGRTDAERFRAACRFAADQDDGNVSVNLVPVLLATEGIGIEHHRYASLWSANTGPGRVMRWTGDWETRSGSRTRNDNKVFKVRKWVGWEPPAVTEWPFLPGMTIAA